MRDRGHILLRLLVLLALVTALAGTVQSAHGVDTPRITAVTNEAEGVGLTWQRVPGAAKYRVFRRTATGWQKLADVTGLRYTDTTAPSGAECRYTLRCVSTDGRRYTSDYDRQGRTVRFYAAPKLTAVANGQAGISLRWQGVGGIDRYRVYRRTNGGGWKGVANVAATGWTDKNTISGCAYTYTVRCLSGSKPVSGYDRKGLTLTRLTAPVLVSAVQGPRETVVTWKAVEGAQRYDVYRKRPGGSWKKLGQSAKLSYTDTTTKESEDYWYTVRAVQGKTLSGYRSGIQAVHRDLVAEAVPKLKTAAKATQLVVVVDHSLTVWDKSGGRWKKTMDVYCGYGKNGFHLPKDRRMGDKTTPIGAFPLTLAFGLGEDPGTLLPYRKITKNSYWSSERSTYNTWVESAKTVGGEHLMDYYQYQYAMVIDFNMNPTVYGRGSGIFLHCKSTDRWSTSGCVSVTESHMLRLMRGVKPGAYMVIVENVDQLADY